jgi:ribosomal protein L30E
MCLGVWSCLGYVKDNDIKAVVIQPEVPANMKEDDLAYHWDAILD